MARTKTPPQPRPDIAFISASRVAEAHTPKFIPVAPELVVETLSPDDRATQVREQTQWWLDHGVQLVWVVDAQNATVRVHLQDDAARTLSRTETLEGDEVLKGFSLPLSELFA